MSRKKNKWVEPDPQVLEWQKRIMFLENQAFRSSEALLALIVQGALEHEIVDAAHTYGQWQRAANKENADYFGMEYPDFHCYPEGAV